MTLASPDAGLSRSHFPDYILRMARKNSSTAIRNAVINDAGETIGWWWLDGSMIRVESRNGQSRATGSSAVGANVDLARIMLSEPWAR